MTIALSLEEDSIRKNWPKLTEENARITSIDDRDYNCLAFVVGDSENFWWPKKEEGIYWPNEFPFLNTLPNVLNMLKAKFNFEKCDSSCLEIGYEKIAIYGEIESYLPKHYAKQLPNGKWKSKLGGLEDIEHDTLDALGGEFYGEPMAIVKRRIVTL